MQTLRARSVAVALVALLGCALVTPTASRADVSHPDWDEWDLARLMNRERWQLGLPPLRVVPALRDLSRAWTATMVSVLELRHDPRLAENIGRVMPSWRGVGENVGYASSLRSLHEAFMTSEHHRANIVNPKFNAVGVGIVWADPGRVWATVKFLAAPPLPAALRTPTSVVRTGSDIDTAIAVSQRRPAKSAPHVVVARADDFADALSGGAMATSEGAPLLLTPTYAPNPAVVAEAARVLKPLGTVQLLGGTGAISLAVQQAFIEAGLVTERIGGPDRYATATVAATRYAAVTPRVFLASGSSYADALAASAIAGVQQAPVILVAEPMPAATTAYLAATQPGERILVGGTAAVSEDAARAVGATVRIGGKDRFETAALLARRFTPTATRVVVASGLRFQDALIAGPEAARMGAMLALTAPGTPRATYEQVAAVNPRWAEALLVGSETHVPTDDVVRLFT